MKKKMRIFFFFLKHNCFWALPNYIVEKKNLGCNTVIVLQRFRLGGYWKVYCNTLYCIAEKEWAAGKLYCNMSSCIARGWLGQDIVLQE